MITGFNTDVRFRDTVYHVQTEDKGTKNPLIESLIYVKGAILDSHRTPYNQYLESSFFSEATLQKILEFQHRQIVSTIKKGQFQKGMSLGAFVEGDFVFELQGPRSASVEPEGHFPASDAQETERARPQQPVPSQQAALSPSRSDAQDPEQPAMEPLPEDQSEAPDRPWTLGEDEGEDLPVEGIEVCVESPAEFFGGSHVELSLYVKERGKSDRIQNSQVIVKIIGTAFSPRLYAGKTDNEGRLRMNFTLPAFSGGSAALIIQASAAGRNDEIKYLIKRK